MAEAPLVPETPRKEQDGPGFILPELHRKITAHPITDNIAAWSRSLEADWNWQGAMISRVCALAKRWSGVDHVRGYHIPGLDAELECPY
jgi:hypothetical protein